MSLEERTLYLLDLPDPLLTSALLPLDQRTRLVCGSACKRLHRACYDAHQAEGRCIDLGSSLTFSLAQQLQLSMQRLESLLLWAHKWGSLVQHLELDLLGASRVSDGSWQSMLGLLYSVLAACPQLHSLALSSHYAGSRALQLRPILEAALQLRELSLRADNVELQPPLPTAAATFGTYLQTLVLQSANNYEGSLRFAPGMAFPAALTKLALDGYRTPEQLPLLALAPCMRLASLDLTCCALAGMGAESWSALAPLAPSMQQLVISDCRLPAPPRGLSFLTGLLALRLDYPRSGRGPVLGGWGPAWEEDFNAMLAPLQQLRLLSLRACRLPALPRGVCNLPALQALYCENNHFSALPEGAELAGLAELSIA